MSKIKKVTIPQSRIYNDSTELKQIIHRVEPHFKTLETEIDLEQTTPFKIEGVGYISEWID